MKAGAMIVAGALGVLGFFVPIGTDSGQALARARVVNSVKGCKVHVHSPEKNAACIHCVKRGGTYIVAGPGRCDMPPPPPPQEVLRTPDECQALQRPGKRQRCVVCTRQGGSFFRAGPGSCKLPPPPPPPEVLRTPQECRALLDPGKRQRCVVCTRKGGSFFRPGPGRCDTPAPAPMMLRSPDDCLAHAKGPGKRRRCTACTRRGGTYSLVHGRCELPPPPPPPDVLRTPPDCRAHIRHPAKRRGCVLCTRRGGTFFRPGPGRCDMPPPPPPPPPPPRVMRTPADCSRYVADPSKRRRCVVCTQRGSLYSPGSGRCDAPRP